MKQIKISVVAAIAIDKLNKPLIEKWINYVDERIIKKERRLN